MVRLRQADAGGRLDRHAHHDLLTGRNAAQHAARVVGEKALRRHFVAVLAALLFTDAAKPAPISTPLTALMPIMA
jgi:hypothetical protein